MGVRRLGCWTLLLLLGCDEDRGGGGNPGGARPDATPGDAAVAMDAGPGQDASGLDAAGMDAMLGPTVPVPPMTAANDWPDTEPNDTPEQAVPVGRLDFALWMGFSGTPNNLSTSADRDYYVFRTGDAQSISNLIALQICANDPIDLFDLYLYSVVNGQVGTLLRSATTTTPSCETIVAQGEAANVFTPDSIYLLEVRPGQGLNISAPALYSA